MKHFFTTRGPVCGLPGLSAFPFIRVSRTLAFLPLSILLMLGIPASVQAQIYCTGGITSPAISCSGGLYINDFSVSGSSGILLNDPGSGCNSTTAYQDRRTLIPAARLSPGGSYTATFVMGNYYMQNFQIWIDFNNDGAFSASETIGGSTGSYATFSIGISLPADAAPGYHTMRVRCDNYSDDHYPSIDPCATTYLYGETQDYTVLVGLTGALAVCSGNTSSLAFSSTGGTWTSDNTSVATIGASSGVLSGLAAGTASISYTLAGSTYTVVATVNASPAVSVGAVSAICAGSSATLTASGGSSYSWSPATGLSAATGAAVVASPLATTGYTVTATNASGCAASAPVMVSVIPAATLSVTATGYCSGSLLTTNASSPFSSITWMRDGLPVRTNAVSGPPSITTIGAGSLASPADVFISAHGDMYVADNNGSRIVKYAAGTTTGGTVVLDGIGARSFYVDADDNIYAMTFDGGLAVRKFAPGSTTGTVVVSTGLPSGYFYAGMSMNASGRLCISDYSNNQILVYSPGFTASTSPYVIPLGSGNSGYRLFIDANDTIYIPLITSASVLRFDPLSGGGYSSGTMVAGTGTVGGGLDQLINPTGVFKDAGGNLFVFDVGMSRVLRFPPGSVSGTVGTLVAGGWGDYGALSNPWSGCVDASGVLYVADLSNSRVQVYSQPSASADTFTAALGGLYTVMAALTSGCTVTSAVTTINAVPAAPSVSVTGTGCGPATITASGEGTIYFQGSEALGTSTVTPSASQEVTSSGTYYFRAYNGTCWSAPAGAAATVHPVPVVSATASGNCPGSVLSVSSDILPATISWFNGGDAPIATASLSYGPLATTVAGQADGTYGSDATHLNAPRAVQTDAAGNIYVADYFNNRVQKFAPGSSTGTTVAGETGVSGSDAAHLGAIYGMYVDPSGNIYIADADNRRIQKWAAGATSGTTVAGETGVYGTDPAHFSFPSGVFVDASGNVYVTDMFANRVQKWAPGATSGITVAGAADGSSGADAAHFQYPMGLYVDASGNIYVNDNGNSRVQKWAPGASSGTTVAGNGTAGNSDAQLYNAFGVTVDVAGNVYVADQNNNRVQKWAPGASSGVTVAGHTGYSGTDPDRISSPQSVCFTPAGDMLVADGYNARVQKFAATIVTTYNALAAGTYSAVVTSLPGCSATTSGLVINPAPAAPVVSGGGAACASSATLTAEGGGGTIYYQGNTASGTSTSVASASHEVFASGTYYFRSLSSDGCWSADAMATVTLYPLASAGFTASSACVGGTLTIPGADSYSKIVWMKDGTSVNTVTATYAADGITAAGVSGSPASDAGSLNYPKYVKLDNEGNILIADFFNHRIQKWAPGATSGTTVAGHADGTYSADATGLFLPSAVAVDAAGNLIIADQANSRVQKWAPGASSGTTIAGNGSYGTADNQFSGLTSVGVDAAGNVYCVDYSNHRIMKWAPGATSGMLVAGETGVQGSDATHLAYPNDIAVLADGTFYVCDYFNSRIQKFTPGSLVGETVAGNADGSPGALQYPQSVTRDNAGNLYLSYNHLIYKWAPGATIGTPVAGLGGYGSGAASLNSPQGTAVDVNGNLYVADYANARIQKFTTSINHSLEATAPGVYNAVVTTVNNCEATTPSVTIYPVPSAGTITLSAPYVCVGSTVTVSSSSEGGSWISSAPSVATITSSGTISGLSAGTAEISYIVSNGCGGALAVATISVISAPSAGTISGASSVITGSTITLTSTVAGGAWSASNTNATVNESTGVVTGVAMGTVTISYAVSNSCGTAYATKSINVTPASNTISGTTTVCTGTTTTFSASIPGGTWTSSFTPVASINASGVVTGIAAGTATISYNLSGAITTVVVTVNTSPANIGGTASVCAGSVTTLTNGTSGGTWTSSNSSIATVSAGAVTGIAAGTATISYTVSNGCFKTATVTVNAAPSSISGILSTCVGSTSTLTNGVSGGVWSSTSTSIVSVGSASGIVTGLAGGTANITYTVAGNCRTTSVFTVSALPAVIGGTLKACPGTSATLTDATGGGTWSSNDAGIATINAALGVFTGVTAGTVYMTYTTGAGCMRATLVTINPNPAAISGTLSLCQGATTALTDATTGGTSWTSSTTAVATVISSSGVVSGVSAGTSTITYTVSTGCKITAVVTVNALPSAITGTLKVCPAGTTTISSSGSGSWSVANAAVASIGSMSGVVAGIAAGTSTVSFTTTDGCSRSAVVTVNPAPGAIGGTASVCQGLITTLSNTGGGTWSSGNTSVATAIATNGAVTGIAAGTANITYTLSTGCYTTKVVTVNALPAAISNAGAICIGATATLSDADAPGTWSSSNVSVASIGSATGIATGVATGTARITYTLTSTTCRTTAVVTVSTGPSAIGGTLGLCNGTVSTLTDASAGGTWSSSNATVATIGSATGAVTALAAGTSIITYATGSSCRATAIVTVSNIAPITGTQSVCAGSATSLSTATTGGTWSSGTPAVATVSTAGVVTCVAAGTATISYSLAGGCRTTATVTVNGMPAAITGTLSVCESSITSLASTTSGGSWSSSTASASVDATGVASGIASGTSTISYALSTGCARSAILTVNPQPSVISGAAAIGSGSTLTLSNTVSGGAWTSSFTSVVSVSSASGIVTGLASGTAIVTYTLPAGCKATTIVTINAMPAAITGTLKACPGTTTTLANATSGGTWSSSNTVVASVNSAGVVTGVTAGTTIVSYITGTATYATAVVTINPLPAAIAGTLSVCAGSTTALTDPTAGGLSWTSSNTAIATVNSTSGVVAGVSAGNATITYTLGTGCSITADVTVNAIPAAIGGSLAACPGYSSVLNNTVSGSWSSSNISIATIDPSGLVIAASAGTTVITFADAATSCYRTAVFTVNPAPAAISGVLSVCQGATSALASSGSGTWSSYDPSVASVTSVSGVVTGVSGGITTVTYTLPTGCLTVANVTVNSSPSAISGSLAVCAGVYSTLSNTAGSGYWSSSNSSVATIGATSGVVSANAAGTSNITFTLFATGCRAVSVLTVNAVPSAISGSLNICTGNSSLLTNASAGGTWASSDESVATVGSATGIVAGIAAGTSSITYTTVAGCAATAVVTVSSLSDIVGVTSACAGSTSTLGVSATGGTWSSGTPAIATIATISPSVIVVTGVASGTAVISYTLPGGCSATTVFTVDAVPAAISGPTQVCIGSVATLGNSVSGGSWFSDGVGTVSVDLTTGAYYGIAAGTSLATYALFYGGGTSRYCLTTVPVTVNPLPADIMGASSTGVGSTISLSDATTGGTWSSSTTAVATVGSSTGVVTGVNLGMAAISYTLPTGCFASAFVTINAAPAGITGTLKACPGTTTTLGSATAGGTWSSTNTSVATISVAGVVSGIAAGTSTISYVTGPGAYVLAVVTINPNPAAITSSSFIICAGSSVAFADATAGGTSWASSTPAVATVNSTSGLVAGVAAGTSVITYTLNTGCYATAVATVVTQPATIGGVAKVCNGLITSLTDATSGGTWSSANIAIASVGSTGAVTGVATGTTNISYSTGPGCYRTVVVTVNATPVAISGTTSLCISSTTTLTDASGSGTWSSSTPSVATINSIGVASGASLGTATISYTFTTGCYATTVVTVGSAPSASTGSMAVCVGSVVTLGNSMPGGTWSSSGTSYATVGSANGMVTGVGAGTVRITYSLGSGCLTYSVVTVNAIPGVNSGTAVVCAGSTTTLTNSTGTGTWSSTNTSVGTIGSVSAVAGRFVGITAGTSVVSFTFANGCARTTIVTVNATPSAGVISASDGFALHTATSPMTSTFVSSGTSGGSWTSSTPAVATVNSSSGLVAAVAPGTSNITYTVTLGSCSATATHTVSVVAPRSGGNTSPENTMGVVEFGVYPNPARDVLNVSTSVSAHFYLLAIDGKEMAQYDLAAGLNTLSLPANIASGIYMCTFIGMDGHIYNSTRLIIE